MATLDDFLAGPFPSLVASVFNPLSARAARAAGFEIGFLGGSALSADLLALPDIGQLSARDLANRARRITDASNLALIVDGDDGFGSVQATAETVRLYEASGASGMTLEDSVQPASGGKQSTDAIPVQDFVDRVAEQPRLGATADLSSLRKPWCWPHMAWTACFTA